MRKRRQRRPDQRGADQSLFRRGVAGRSDRRTGRRLLRLPGRGDHIETIFRDYPDTVPRIGLAAVGLTADGSRFDTTLMGWATYAAGLSATDDPYDPRTFALTASTTYRSGVVVNEYARRR
ncbi:hypothetical protein PSU4_10510 [Pseudonocardia sulfidoxydans NBRC 16205]|uniref:Uncharacterized protein n=1 Tax=Pseudonocardia sulfidoxydans NBRC 16205 TaxID=1223511 RepID=A0A511DBZ8_9PSEU|nr:hypothetical protein PSU4_10510 [Pseudonocardia sulfidoxydans NBRC 16205]